MPLTQSDATQHEFTDPSSAPLCPPEVIGQRSSAATTLAGVVACGIAVLCALLVLAEFTCSGTVLAVPHQPVRWGQIDVSLDDLTVVASDPHAYFDRDLLTCATVTLRNRTDVGQLMPPAELFSLLYRGRVLPPAPTPSSRQHAYPADDLLGPDDARYDLCYLSPRGATNDDFVFRLGSQAKTFGRTPTYLWRLAGWKTS